MSMKQTLPLASKARGKSGKWTVHPAAHEVVRNMRANGCAKATVASALGMTVDGLDGAIERDEALAAAFAEGNALMHDELVGILMQQARDGYAPAAMFLLKASHGYRDNTPVPQTDAKTVNIVIPPAASADELAKLTAAMRDVTPQPDPLSAPSDAPAKRQEIIL